MRIGLIGATGLIGSHLLERLPAADVLVLTRRPTGREPIRELVAPGAEWTRLLAKERLDVAISTLGTTWRKAGSWPAFEAVDRTMVIDFARAARRAGARQMISVSSVGADPRSKNGYLALKGQVEDELAAIGFDRLDLLRPGLLRGQRSADRRLGERLGIAVSPLVNLFLKGPLDRFAAIDASLVAAAIASLVRRGGEGRLIHDNRAIRALAREGDAGLALR